MERRKRCLHVGKSHRLLQRKGEKVSARIHELNRNIGFEDLDQLRVLNFKGHSLSGQIPNLSGLNNLKSIYLNDNNFSGEFPASDPILHRVKVIVLSGNKISGEIPASLLKLPRLYVLYLQDNLFTGTISTFNQTGLRYLNVSNNILSGEISVTTVMNRFNASSFSGNPGFCGEKEQSIVTVDESQ